MGNSGWVNELVLQKKAWFHLSVNIQSNRLLTGTFFCVTTTAVSTPFRATEVRPPWLMALNAYSKSLQEIGFKCELLCRSKFTSTYQLDKDVLQEKRLWYACRNLRYYLLTWRKLLTEDFKLYSICFKYRTKKQLVSSVRSRPRNDLKKLTALGLLLWGKVIVLKSNTR